MEIIRTTNASKKKPGVSEISGPVQGGQRGGKGLLMEGVHPSAGEGFFFFGFLGFGRIVSRKKRGKKATRENVKRGPARCQMGDAVEEAS